MKKTIILSTVIGSLFFASCTEEAAIPTNSNGPETKIEKSLSEELIGTWNETSLTVTPAVMIGDQSTNNPYDFIDDCEKDDLIVLKAGNQMELQEGAIICDPNAPASAPGSWEVHEDRSTLIMNGTKYRIVEVAENELVLTYDKFMNEELHTFTTTFARK